jgi:hypothetical protein
MILMEDTMGTVEIVVEEVNWDGLMRTEVVLD